MSKETIPAILDELFGDSEDDEISTSCNDSDHMIPLTQLQSSKSDGGRGLFAIHSEGLSTGRV